MAQSKNIEANQAPAPLWPGAPRYCPDLAFPPYSYVPGQNPHPITNPKGHSYGQESKPEYRPPGQWRANIPYMYGIDLYHYGYLWEAHEAWESIWRLVERDGLEGLYLRALIQNSAAQLKVRTNHARGVRTLSMRVGGFLNTVQSEIPGERFMGVHIANLLAEVREHYRPMWATHTPEDVVVQGPPPRLVPKWDET